MLQVGSFFCTNTFVYVALWRFKHHTSDVVASFEEAWVPSCVIHRGLQWQTTLC